MKLSKNKIVFSSIISSIIIFLVSYGYSVYDNDSDKNPSLIAPDVPVPVVKDSIYSDRLQAIEEIKEERDLLLPDVYEEGQNILEVTPDPDVIYGIMDDAPEGLDALPLEEETFEGTMPVQPESSRQPLWPKEDPIFSKDIQNPETGAVLKAMVFSDQWIISGDRVKLLIQIRQEGGQWEHAIAYGRSKLSGNRLSIEVVLDEGETWTAYDPQDLGEGVYITMKQPPSAIGEITGELTSTIQVPGLPLVPRIRNFLFTGRSQRKIKLYNQFKFHLKPKL